LAPVSDFPALGAGFSFSRACRRFQLFPRLPRVSAFSALGAGYMFLALGAGFSFSFHALNKLQKKDYPSYRIIQ